MRKQFLGIGLLLLLILGIFPIVMAQEDSTNETSVSVTSASETSVNETTINEENINEETIAETTLAEVSTMNQGIGAQVRLLQLEKSITRNILAGNKVIARITDNGTDTTDLEALITELEALKLEVQNLDPNADDAVETFVNVKQEAIEISKEFRDSARKLLGEGDRLAIAKKIKDMDKTELKEYNDKIKSRIHNLNAEIVKKTFNTLGIEDEELISKLQNGDATFSEVRNEIKTTIQNMTPEEKKVARANIKESGVRKDVAARAKIEKARMNLNERKAKRLGWLSKASARIQNPEKKARVQSALDKRSTMVNERIDNIANRLEKAKEVKQNINRKMIARGALR